MYKDRWNAKGDEKIPHNKQKKKHPSHQKAQKHLDLKTTKQKAFLPRSV